MKLLDNLPPWNEFEKLKTQEKTKYFAKNSRIFDILFSQQFDRDFLDHLYILTNKIRLIHKTNDGAHWLSGLLANKKAMLYFIQPSTRTFLSFSTACQTLGIKISDVRSQETSSELKGESFDDTIRAFSSYFDMIVMRHHEGGFAEKASYILNNTKRPIPIINAGAGKDQHPTQALLDIFTLRKSFSSVGGLKNKTIMMVGDLKRGRTVRSLCYLLSNFEGIKIIFSSPKSFKMSPDILKFLEKKNVEYLETEEFKEQLPHSDAVYMTRLQDEHDTAGESKSFDHDKYTLNKDALKDLKHTAVILHPLPRRQEISPEVDDDPRAVYWRQVRNGMWTRVAILAYIFKVDQKILDK